MKGIHDFEPGDIKIVLSRHRLDLDTTSMRQICDCLPAERWRELLSVRHCKRKLSVLKRRFRFDDVRCPDVSVAVLIRTAIPKPATPIPATSTMTAIFKWVI